VLLVNLMNFALLQHLFKSLKFIVSKETYSLQIKEKKIDYTDDCRQAEYPYSRCSDFLKNNTGGQCFCQIKFNLTENFEVCTKFMIL